MQPIVGALSQWSPLAVTLLNFGLTFAVLSIVAFIASRWLFDSGAENLSWTQCVSILLPIIPFMFLRSRSTMASMLASFSSANRSSACCNISASRSSSSTMQMRMESMILPSRDGVWEAVIV